MSDEKKPAKKAGRIAVILLRGRIGLHRDVKYTLDLLRLRKKHVCVIVADTPATKGMLQKVKDAVTWGTITDDTYKQLVDARGKKDVEGNLKPFFALNPPKGGFERKGIKTPFNLGGALGNRKDKMDELIKKMI